MKRQIYRHLLIVVGVILLVGLIASCGGDSEPEFKVIESRAYNSANQEATYKALYNKYMPGKSYLSNGQQIYNSYKNDLEPLLLDELKNKRPAFGTGLVTVLKVSSSYKTIGYLFYTSPSATYWKYDFWVFSN